MVEELSWLDIGILHPYTQSLQSSRRISRTYHTQASMEKFTT